MIKKFLKSFKLITIDVLVYRMTNVAFLSFQDLELEIQTETISKGKKKYFITKNGVSIHTSFFFDNIYLLGLLKKRGSTIGDCYTHPEYRGKSIFPYVINYIAREILVEYKKDEVFIIVNQNNLNSIKGIEKAGFKRYASIITKRWLFWYFDKKIKIV